MDMELDLFLALQSSEQWDMIDLGTGSEVNEWQAVE